MCGLSCIHECKTSASSPLHCNCTFVKADAASRAGPLAMNYINHQAINGSTALMWAAHNGKLEVASHDVNSNVKVFT